MNMCENLTDPEGHWTKTNGTSTFNPAINETHTYLQNCTVWSFDFRKNETHCPARMRPDCFLVNSDIYKPDCPFAPSQRGGFVTNELCECLGVTKEQMKIGHPIYCTCTRNLKKPVLYNERKTCNEHYLFTKKCKVQWPYTARSGGSTVNRYYFNCSFVECHELDATPLFHIMGFNTTCSNATSMDKIYTTKKTPTTTTTTTTALPTTETTTSITFTSTSTTTTTIAGTTPSPPSTTSTTTSPTTTITTTPTSQAKESVSITVSDPINSDITTINDESTNNISYSVNPSPHSISVFRDNNMSLMELLPSNIEYSKQMNEYSLFGIMLFVAVIQIFFIFTAGFVVKKRRQEQYSY